MTETHNAKYNFKEHIVNLSNSDNFDDALKEWIQMPEIYKKLHKGSCKCICQRKIKQFYYIYNKFTFKYINVGTGCYKKFNFTITNTEMPILLQDMLQRYAIGEGEYEDIEDLDEYSTNIKLRIEQELTDMYKRWDTDIINLYKLKDDIIELIEDYNFTCLEELKNLVIETINVLEKEKVEKEKIKQKLEEERIKKEKIEREEHIKQEKIYKEELDKKISEENKIRKEKEKKIKQEKNRKFKEKLIHYEFNKNKFSELDNKSLIYLKNNTKDFEFYIRYKLGQRIFFDYEEHNHLRFNFNSQSEANDTIIKQFTKFYKNKELLYNINKTEFIGLFIDVTDTKNYSRKDLLNHKDVIKIDSRRGTIHIIMDILNNIS